MKTLVAALVGSAFAFASLSSSAAWNDQSVRAHDRVVHSTNVAKGKYHSVNKRHVKHRHHVRHVRHTHHDHRY